MGPDLSLHSEVTFTAFNGFLLILPLLAIGFVIPPLLDRQAPARLNFFPELRGLEKKLLPVYFVTNTFLLFSPLVARIEMHTPYTYPGLFVCALGRLFLMAGNRPFSDPFGGMLVQRNFWQ